MKYIFIGTALLFLFQVSDAQGIIRTNEKQAATAIKNKIIGLLGAFPPELVLLRQEMKQEKDTIIQGIHFYRGVLSGKNVVLAQTGIGKVNAAITAILLIHIFNPEEIIFTGIAGGLNPSLSPGDIVIAKAVAHHDYGTITADSLKMRPTKDPVSMEENPLFFPCDNNLIQLAFETCKTASLQSLHRAAGETRPGCIIGNIITGDVFISSSQLSKKFHEQLNADATEMEGAAVAQVCWQQKTPFLLIRSLSDDAGNHAYMNMKSFYQAAAHNSASLVIALLSKIP